MKRSMGQRLGRLSRRELTPAGRMTLLALGLLILALTAAVTARLLPEETGGAAPATAETNMETMSDTEITAALSETAAEQAGAPLTPVLAEEQPAAEEEEDAAAEDAESDAEEAEDGQARHTAQIDLSRVISGEARIIRPYGYDYNPNTEDYRFHRGCDLAAAAGQPLFAPAAGRVSQAEEDGYWGGVVVIDHGGWSTVLRCVTPRVEAGSTVTAGDFVASAAPAPAEAAEDAHFHLEVEAQGQSLDPARFF
ncbi:MAG: M23 family metallopeptidase [Firmicutes bacterium]|nr:M23 family metallopeptidase [Bacillota bacterium]